MLHPDIDKIVNGIISQKRFVNLATNGLLLESSLERFKPSPYLYLVLHLDSLAETHDRYAGRKGIFDTAISAIKAAKKAGFQVLINTTIYKQTNIEEIKAAFYLAGRNSGERHYGSSGLQLRSGERGCFPFPPGNSKSFSTGV